MNRGSRLFVADAVHGHPGARGVLVREDRVDRVLDERQLADARAEGIVVHDLGGFLYPGFTDAHSHPSLAANLMRGADLTAVHTISDLRAAVATIASTLNLGEWVLGWGLQYSPWGADAPTFAAIADVTEAPVALQMFDCHALLLNEAALRIARVDQMPDFVSGAHAVMGSDGRPTGLIVEEEAMDYVRAAFPPDTEAAKLDRLARLLADMADSGLTGLHVMDALEGSAAQYAEIERENRLPLRLKLHRWLTPAMADAGIEAQIPTPDQGELWRHHGVKLFLDGTVDNGTAWLSHPDVHGQSTQGIWSDPDAYTRTVAALAAAGVPTATHAIGDAAIRWAAGAIGAAHQRHPKIRHRIEHLEVSDDAVIRAVRESGAAASMQPTHCTHFVAADGSDSWSRRLGERARHGWPLRSFVDAGVPLALGSDFPIAPFAPLPTIADAQLRYKVGTDAQPVGTGEGINASEAVDGYTRGPAVAAGVDADEGTIASGMRADFSVFSGDILTTHPGDLPRLEAVATIVGGRLRSGAVGADDALRDAGGERVA